MGVGNRLNTMPIQRIVHHSFRMLIELCRMAQSGSDRMDGLHRKTQSGSDRMDGLHRKTQIDDRMVTAPVHGGAY